MAGLVEKAKKNNVKLVFPIDYITADKFDKDAKVRAHEFPRARRSLNCFADRHRDRGRRYSGWLDGSGRRPQEPRALPQDCLGSEDHSLEWVRWFSSFLVPLTDILHRPPGVFEFPAFAEGSTSLLDANIEAAKNGAVVIVGGGDTATVVAQHGAEDKLSHVSTGGGASLELLEGKVRMNG